MTASPLSPAAIASNRFGLGASPADGVPGNPKAWLLNQFSRYDPRPAEFAALADAGDAVRRYREEQRAARMASNAALPSQASAPPAESTMSPAMNATAPMAVSPIQPGSKPAIKAARQDFRQDVQALYRAAVQARTDSALQTQAPFVERMVHFWSNHFCISADNPQTTAFAGAFERDAIRPHVLGRFSDMLLAVEQHPGMLIYLNQFNSVGPNSALAARAAQRNPARKIGLNENLGREIMELHTLGVRSGYSQADVTEFARALTGWTIGGDGPGAAAGSGDPNVFVFRPALHEPGPRMILGKTYDEEGEGQGQAVLSDLARHKATSVHIATKLARHFAGDTPPPPLVARLSADFQKTGGDLPSLYRTLINSPEPWSPAPLKFKTPWEWTISALRGLGRTETGQMQIAAAQVQLGQPVWKPGSPAGWDDIAASWAAPDALLRRVEFASRIAGSLGDRLDARALGPQLIPASLSATTAEQLARSESPAGALALLLVSPDFMRR